MRRTRAYAAAAILFSIIFVTQPAAASFIEGGAIYLKTGAMHLRDTSQVVETSPHIPVQISLDNNSDYTYGLSLEFHMRHDLAITLEFMDYKHRFWPSALPSESGWASTSALILGAKKYFFSSGNFHPYIGAGAGTSYSRSKNLANGGSIDDQYYTVAVLATLGVEWRMDNLSIMLESKTLYSLGNKSAVEYDPYAAGLLLGAGYRW